MFDSRFGALPILDLRLPGGAERMPSMREQGDSYGQRSNEC